LNIIYALGRQYSAFSNIKRENKNRRKANGRDFTIWGDVEIATTTATTASTTATSEP